MPHLRWHRIHDSAKDAASATARDAMSPATAKDATTMVTTPVKTHNKSQPVTSINSPIWMPHLRWHRSHDSAKDADSARPGTPCPQQRLKMPHLRQHIQQTNNTLLSNIVTQTSVSCTYQTVHPYAQTTADWPCSYNRDNNSHHPGISPGHTQQMGMTSGTSEQSV